MFVGSPSVTIADLANSIYWGGITSVTANGQPDTSFILTSDSGTDWSHSFIPATTGVSRSPVPRHWLARCSEDCSWSAAGGAPTSGPGAGNAI